MSEIQRVSSRLIKDIKADEKKTSPEYEALQKD